jgi:hypothetical protein
MVLDKVFHPTGGSSIIRSRGGFDLRLQFEIDPHDKSWVCVRHVVSTLLTSCVPHGIHHSGSMVNLKEHA